jgi:predicted DNA-binding protein YlxM (UPF0122 family)
MTAESIKPIQISKPKRLTALDKHKAIDMKMKGATYTDIAKLQGVSKQAIHQAIKGMLPDDVTTSFGEHKADILRNTQLRYIQLLDDDIIKKNLSQRGVTDIAILMDKERLERGQASQIIQANTITGSLRDLVDLITGKTAAIDITPSTENGLGSTIEALDV